jgi:hypothetical protein
VKQYIFTASCRDNGDPGILVRQPLFHELFLRTAQDHGIARNAQALPDLLHLLRVDLL